MGGLVLALALQKCCQNIEVDIYESTSELTDVGVGIGMHPRVWEIVKSLGLEDDLLQSMGNQGSPAGE